MCGTAQPSEIRQLKERLRLQSNPRPMDEYTRYSNNPSGRFMEMEGADVFSRLLSINAISGTVRGSNVSNTNVNQQVELLWQRIPSVLTPLPTDLRTWIMTTLTNERNTGNPTLNSLQRAIDRSNGGSMPSRIRLTNNEVPLSLDNRVRIVFMLPNDVCHKTWSEWCELERKELEYINPSITTPNSPSSSVGNWKEILPMFHYSPFVIMHPSKVSLRLGDRVDVLGYNLKWCEGRILGFGSNGASIPRMENGVVIRNPSSTGSLVSPSIDPSTVTHAFIQYLGYPSSYDRWVPLYTVTGGSKQLVCIHPCGTYTRDWRDELYRWFASDSSSSSSSSSPSASRSGKVKRSTGATNTSIPSEVPKQPYYIEFMNPKSKEWEVQIVQSLRPVTAAPTTGDHNKTETIGFRKDGFNQYPDVILSVHSSSKVDKTLVTHEYLYNLNNSDQLAPIFTHTSTGDASSIVFSPGIYTFIKVQGSGAQQPSTSDIAFELGESSGLRMYTDRTILPSTYHCSLHTDTAAAS